jgi:DNA-binding transcriptional ArsR family regulator
MSRRGKRPLRRAVSRPGQGGVAALQPPFSGYGGARRATRPGVRRCETRLTLAAALAEGDELCVCDLAWVVERAENLVSHHLRLLRSDGLVTSRRDGKMVMYSLTPAGRELLAQTLAQEAPA